MKRFFSILARYPSHCVECRERIYEGDEIVFDSKERKVYCKECGKEIDDE